MSKPSLKRLEELVADGWSTDETRKAMPALLRIARAARDYAESMAYVPLDEATVPKAKELIDALREVEP